MPEEPEAIGDPHPIIPTSEKAVGAIDLGIITGAAAIVAGLLMIRWIKVRAAAKLMEQAAPNGAATG
jgi:hypothetical protein